MAQPARVSRMERHRAKWIERHLGRDAWMSGHAEFAPWNFEPPPPRHTPRWATLWLPVIVSFLVQVPVAIGSARFFAEGPNQALFNIGIAVLGPLALIGARRFPGPVVALTAIGGSLDILFNDHSGPPYLALAFGIVSAIVRNARVWAWISIAVAWVSTLSIALVLGNDHLTAGRIAATTLGILIVVGIAEGMRTRRERAAQYLRMIGERRQTEVQAERVRIARELHDVLAHSLSQINVQASVGLHLMDKHPEKAKEALSSIKETSKTALDEVRSVLGVLRAEGGADPNAPLVPEPDLSRLPGLAASMSEQGLDVRLDDRLLLDEVPKRVQLALYRIAQESLTNVGRHADGATRATVTLQRQDDAYRIEVRDDGAGSIPTPASETGGRGLLGMRERAELLGGHLSAGPAEGGGFAVVAELPARTTEGVSA